MKPNLMKKPAYNITDEYLERGPFHQLQSLFLGNGTIPWDFNEHKVWKDDNSIHNFQFVHTFFRGDVGLKSSHYSQITPLLKKIDPAVWIRIKANMVPYNDKIIEFDLHTDTEYKCTTAVYFLNTCDGYLYFKDGSKVETIANRLVTFPSWYLHAGTTCTDDKVRCVLNLNFIEKRHLKYEKEI